MRLLADERVRAVIVLAVFGFIVMQSPSWVITGLTVEDGEDVVHAETFRGTVSDALQQLDVPLTSGDRVTPAPDAQLSRGMTVTVERGIAATIAVDGRQIVHRAPARTVREFLADAGVTVGPMDRVTPPLDTFVDEDIVIRVVRVREEEYVVEAPVPFDTWRWAEPKWEKGYVGVLREGREGTELRTIRATYEDDRLVHQLVIDRETVESPRAEIIGIGTRIVVREMDTPAGTIRYTDVLDMEATAYYPGPESTGVWADGFTSMGLKAGHGVIAVDPSVIPLGTKVYIPGYGIAIAGDVGGAIKGNIIDLAFDTYREAMHFGRQRVKVYILAAD